MKSSPYGPVSTGGDQQPPHQKEGRVFRQVKRGERRSQASVILALLGFIGLCLLVGAAGGTLTADAVRHWYPSLIAPPMTPPSWVFAPVWSGLYILIGVAAWLVWLRPGHPPALRLWGWQLAANAAWPAVFFGLRCPVAGLPVILTMVVLTVLTIRAFERRSGPAALLMLPYLAWILFATYLNTGFWWLNRT
jgi:translocator protein